VPSAGAYTLYTNSDDGVRLRVGTALAIDDWAIRVVTERAATLQLPSGNLPISLEYFQAYGPTEVHLSWAGPGIAKQLIPTANLTAVQFATTRTIYDENITGLRGSYFNNVSLAGRPTLLRTDSPVGSFSFNWNTASPDPSLATTNYSVRWSGVLMAPASGNYRIGANVDDGVRIYVDGTLQLDHWSDSAPAEYASPSFFLGQGIHKLVVEYYQHLSGAVITLRWQKPSDSATVDVPSSSLAPNYGLATTAIDPNGHLTSYSYSGGGLDTVRGLETDKTVVNVDADGTSVTYKWHTAYDTYARTTSSTSAKGMTGANPDPSYTRAYTYFDQGDSLGRDGFLKSVSVPGVGTTSYDYERPTNGAPFSSGWMTQKVDQHGTWVYAYDPLGNRTAVTPPGRSQSTVSDFDADNNLTRVSDPQGGTISFTYDEMDRLTNTSVYDNFYGVPTPQQTPDASSTASYDAEGHPLVVSDGAGATTYGYDERGSVKAMTDSAQRQVSFAYDDAGRLKTKNLPNGTIVHYARDSAGRVTNLQNHLASNETALANADYAAVYDPAGKMMSVAGPDGTNRYAYDIIGRLEVWTDPLLGRHRYFFDLDSNRTQITMNGANVHAYSYASNLSDQLTQVDGSAFSYNPAGDTIARPADGARPAQTLGWEPHGNIQSVTSPDNASVTFVRDALGRVRERIQKDPTGAVVADTRFRFAGSGSAASFETDTSNNVTKSYLSGPEGLTTVYSGNRSGSASFVYVDIHGNIVLTADSVGAVTGGPFTYDPFGNLTGSTNPGQYGFVGKWQKYTDQFSGLILMGARPYDPTLGRFLSADPVADGSGNVYDYAGQDPINAYDLDGNKCHGWFSLCTLGFVARIVSVVPGPVGMIAAGVSVGAYLAAGEYGEAAGSALAFIPGGILLRVAVGRLGGAKLLGLATRLQYKAPIIGGRGFLFGHNVAPGGKALGILNRSRTGLKVGWSNKAPQGWAFSVAWARRHFDYFGITDGYLR
jgi:RHS repeat-associated protein